MTDVPIRVTTLGLLVAADGVFLWMFLSTDPLEQVAAALRHTHPSRADTVLAFAASWRHGMAGNSWIYMPGFFVTAAALWLHSRHARMPLAVGERLLAGLAAIGLSFAASATGASIVFREFVAATGTDVGSLIPTSSWGGTIRGLYTLTTWSVFVLACRAALVRRTLRPFVPVAVLTVGLMFVRTWTVNDFVGHWAAGATSGSIPALTSFALVFIVATLLAVVERSAQPQPRERALGLCDVSRRDDEKQVPSGGDQIKTR